MGARHLQLVRTPFAQAMYSHRERKGIGQHAATAELNAIASRRGDGVVFCQSMVCDLENGERTPQERHYGVLAEWLGIHKKQVATMVNKSRHGAHAYGGDGHGFAERFVKLRRKAGIASQAEAARRLTVLLGRKVSPKTVSRWENQRRLPTEAEFAAILNMLSIEESPQLLLPEMEGTQVTQEQPPEPPAPPQGEQGQGPPSALNERQQAVLARLTEALPPTKVAPENLGLWGQYIYYLASLS